MKNSSKDQLKSIGILVGVISAVMIVFLVLKNISPVLGWIFYAVALVCLFIYFRKHPLKAASKNDETKNINAATLTSIDLEEPKNTEQTMAFSGFGIKNWELKNDRIVASKRVILLRDIIAIVDGAPTSDKNLGVINLWLREGTGNMDFFSLRYLYSSLNEGKKAVAYMRKNSSDVFTKLDILGVGNDEEVHVRCNACGEVYSFTPKEINEKLNSVVQAIQQEKNAKVNAVGAVGNAIGGTILNANLQSMRAETNLQNARNAKKEFVDYSKCISCRSSDIERMSEMQWREHLDQMKMHRNTAQTMCAVSAADELLKFKGLLESGVITQEEFDAKKKQLLGL